MKVQRGATTMTATSSTVTLGTPVKVGESFVVATIKSENARPDSGMPEIYLDTVSGGNYTQLKMVRSRASSGESVTVNWQVVTG
jgi:hypothetical protein